MKNKIYAVFENDNEIDVNAFRLLGASSKETQSDKIGFWGSGLKYSIAVLLRNNIDIKGFTGNKEIKIATKKTKMRDDEFDVITINKKETGFTTRTGKDWELWFAIREIFANCLDEGGFKRTVSDNPVGEVSKTRICIELTDQIKAIFSDWDKYFNDLREPLFFSDVGGVKLYRKLGTKGIIYRRGFKVGELENALFDYDIKDIGINESRVINSFWELDYHLVKFWKYYADKKYVAELLNTPDCHEVKMNSWYNHGNFSDVWKEIIGRRIVIPNEVAGFYTDDLKKPHILLPQNLAKELKKSFGETMNVKGYGDTGEEQGYKFIELGGYERGLVESNVKLLEKYGFNFSGINYKFVEFLDKDVLGQADLEKNTILISENAIINDTLLPVIIEEYCHLKSGKDDYTRGFQNYIFGMFASVINRVNKNEN